MKTGKLLLALCVLGCTAVFAAVEPTSSQELKLLRGWNLVTLLRPLEPSSATAFLALKPMTLENNTYVQCTTSDKLKVGCGYWVFCRKEMNVVLVHDVEKTAVPPTLVTGWNLIGYEKGWIWPDLASIIWQWNGIAGFSEVEKKTPLGEDGSTYFVIAE